MKDAKWDSFRFGGLLQVPSESLGTRAFISKEFMAQRIVEIAYNAHQFGSLCEGEKTNAGTFISNLCRASFYNKSFMEKRKDFMIGMSGAGLKNINDGSVDPIMCFKKYYDLDYGYGTRCNSSLEIFEKVGACPWNIVSSLFLSFASFWAGNLHGNARPCMRISQLF